MRNLEQQLTMYGEVLEHHQGPLRLDEITDATDTVVLSPSVTRRGRWGWAFVAAAVVFVLIGAIPLLNLLTQGSSPSPSTQPASLSTTTPSSVPATAPETTGPTVANTIPTTTQPVDSVLPIAEGFTVDAGPLGTLTWSKFVHDTSSSASIYEDPAGEYVLAWGPDVSASADGLNWHHHPEFHGDYVELRGGWAVTGHFNESRDFHRWMGTGWEKTTIVDQPSPAERGVGDLTYSGPAEAEGVSLLAANLATQGDQTGTAASLEVWRHTDVGRFEVIDVPWSPATNVQVAVTPNGSFLALVFRSDDGEGADVEVWQSDDGLAWTNLGEPPFSPVDFFPSVEAVSLDRSVVVRVWDFTPEMTRFWSTQDGVTWTDFATFVSAQCQPADACNSNRIVAVIGREDWQFGLSTDGETWTEVPIPPQSDTNEFYQFGAEATGDLIYWGYQRQRDPSVTWIGTFTDRP